MEAIINLTCFVAVSIILTCMGYNAGKWQWWAIMLLMIVYGITY